MEDMTGKIYSDGVRRLGGGGVSAGGGYQHDGGRAEGGVASEASRMLEAALEQMDGIIQGAKYDLPQFDNFSIQESAGVTVSVSEAMKNLKRAILNASKDDPKQIDSETREFIWNWFMNNRSNCNKNSQNKYQQQWWKQDDNYGVHDLTRLEERTQELERDKDSLQLQVTVLEDQIESKSKEIRDLERKLHDRDVKAAKLEESLERERNLRSGSEIKTGELRTELAGLKLKCARLERDIAEYRNTTPKMPRTISGQISQVAAGGGLPRSPTPVSSPDENSLSSPHAASYNNRAGGAVVLSDDENGFDTSHEMDTSMVSLSGRSTRSIKKILGKIKRSNSGGFEADRARSQASGGKETSAFVRGNSRATVNGRLGWSNFSSGANGANSVLMSTMKKKRFSDWSVDMLCTWLETMGLGQYTGEVQRHIGTGADLAKLGGTELDVKLGIKNPLHRKKLILAMQAKIDPKRPDPAGGLDCAWVVRWLDDIGLPQYKESFLECRVDGRLLNLLTVDDLGYLKVTTLLHHCSIRRGIQVLRDYKFDPDFLKRRATEEEDDNNILSWSNHRVMEWLRQVDLAEYAPNLRGSGVHGALVALEPKFDAELLATLLSISSSKSLLRRHLNIHFSSLIGRDIMMEKRNIQSDPNFYPLTPTAKHKYKHGQFTLKRKKSKAELDGEDCLVCPFSPTAGIKIKQVQN